MQGCLFDYTTHTVMADNLKNQENNNNNVHPSMTLKIILKYKIVFETLPSSPKNETTLPLEKKNIVILSLTYF